MRRRVITKSVDELGESEEVCWNINRGKFFSSCCSDAPTCLTKTAKLPSRGPEGSVCQTQGIRITDQGIKESSNLSIIVSLKKIPKNKSDQ